MRMWNEAQTHRPDSIPVRARLAPESEPGAPMRILGRIVAPDGRTPVADAEIFGYQTDAAGVYSGPGKPGRPWRLQGWARTDADGRFEFMTIRPAAYPGRTEPAHVHLTVVTRQYGRQWTQELHFADDRFVTAEERRASAAAAPFGGVCEIEKQDGLEQVRFSVRLKPKGDF